MSNSFELFSLSHIITVMVISVLVSTGIILLKRVYRTGYYGVFDIFLTLLLLIQVVFWRVMFLLKGDFRIGYDLPFHVCGIVSILMVIYLLKPRQVLFNILYYWGMTGAVLALIIPNIDTNFPSVRYFALFGSHGLELFIMLYLIIVQKKHPEKNSWVTAYIALIVYAFIFALPLDLLLDGNYLFMLDVPDVRFGPIALLPSWPWYLLVLGLFFLLLFRILYEPFRNRLVAEEGKSGVPEPVKCPR